MTQEHRTLFHTTMSSLVNLGRIMPSTLLNDALAQIFHLNSKEGFVRQIIGWREFVHHVHELETALQPIQPLSKQDLLLAGKEIGQQPKSLQMFWRIHELPPTFWGEKSGMLCLSSGFRCCRNRLTPYSSPNGPCKYWKLLGIHPRELTDWFWAMFTDAYDWVVEPNVLAYGNLCGWRSDDY